MDFSGISPYDGTLSQGENGELVYAGGDELHYGGDEGVYPLSEDAFIPEAFATDTEFIESHTLLADGGEHYGVASLAFDIEEELLWMGNQGGHVTSYYGTDMQKYTSFQVHANEEVRQILTTEIGVLALTSSSLRGQMRRGIPLFTHCSENMVEMQCMLQTTPTTLLMGGHQDKLIEFDLTEGVETNYVSSSSLLSLMREACTCKTLLLAHQDNILSSRNTLQTPKRLEPFIPCLEVDVGENGCAILRPHSRFICAGDPSGRICLRDPNTLSVEHTLETHTASLSDFDVHGNLLVTCGFSNRQGALTVDRFLMVYDLRMLRAVSPIPVVLDPLLLRFMPSFSSRLAVVSVTGQLQLADTVSLSTPNLSLYQVNMGGSMCLSLDVSSSCQSLAVGDNGGVIHLFTQSTAVFNTFSRPTEFADTPDHIEPFAVDDDSAIYANIPLQHPPTGTKLLSDWPAECLKKVYRPTPPIDPKILETMKMQDTIGYAPNPMTKRRNQVCYKLDGSGRSGRNTLNGHGSGDSRGKSDEAGFIAIPWRYRKVDIKYSRLGQEDFDFEQYNSTPFSGLEASLQNSYSNAMLQVLYFIDPLRRLLLSHLCQKEFCLACELGFLFHMLDSAKGFPCQAANFQRAFRTVPEAYGLGLLLSDQNPEKKTNLIRLIQSWNRFILHQIHREFLESQKQQQIEEQSQFVYNESDFPAISRRDNNAPPATTGAAKTTEDTDSARNDDTTFISNLLGSRQSLTHRCFKCGHQVVKESVVLLCNLVYPAIDEKSDPSDYEFPSVLAQSLCPKKTTPAWCDQCAKFQPTEHLRGIQQLPQILSVNCGMDTDQDLHFWRGQVETVSKRATENASVQSPGRPCRYGSACSRPNCRFRHPTIASAEKTSDAPAPNPKQHSSSNKPWLPHSIRLERLSSGAVRASSVDAQPPDDENVVETIIYDLSAVICHVNDERKNVVALINVAPSYFERAGLKPRTSWYIFNDFSVTPVPQQEAVWFSLDWKVPCVLYWTNRNLRSDVTPPVINPITLDVFGEDNSLARNNGARKMITFTPLMPDEMPAPGELVAMDAEFVTLNQEEAELRSDGKVSTVKPSHKSVARITCVRGQGPLEGTPFIDDYISTQEQVVDYLTKFSGIEPGDLDANFSSKHLTTLKSTYQKLRFLIDNGVKFVGHGLKNDFRVINLIVPPEQIADTVLLFNLPNHRLVSLRFLSWHFLGVTIQSGSHDSIEDARAALQLYRHYQQLEAEGKVQEALLDLYQTGNAMQWTVPGENGK